MRNQILLPLCCLLATGLCVATASDPNHPEWLGSFKGRGQVDAQVVGPGPTSGSERLYATYTYPQSTFDLVAVDPADGQHRVFPSPVAGEPGAKGLVLGEDENLYLGTYPKGYLLSFSPRTGTISNLGRLAPKDPECWIWEMALASDHRIYFATSPSAKLLRFDPATRVVEDLGRMSSTESYARYLATSRDGFVYIGVGLGTAQLVAYEIATREHRPILPPEFQKPSTAVQVYRGGDGYAYANVGGKSFRVRGWKAEPIATGEAPEPLSQTRLHGDRTISLDINGLLTRRALLPPNSTQVAHGGAQPTITESIVPLKYEGKAQPPFRFTLEADGHLIGSSAYPAYLFRMDPISRKTTNLGLIGPGEAYQLLPHKGRVALALYAGFGGFNLMLFDPLRPFDLRFNPATPYLASSTKATNPLGVNLANTQGNWRPKGMVHGPDGKIYLGGVPGYGLLGGNLFVWDPDLNALQTHSISCDLSVLSLCTTQGLIVAGTSTEGGSGSHRIAKEGTLFLWNPVTQTKVFEVTPVPGESLVTNLVATPEGMIYGVAGASEAFKFDPHTRSLTRLGKLPCTCDIYSAAGLGPDGNVYGLAREGIYFINTRTGTAGLLATAHDTVTAGFALANGYIYFACGADIYRFKLPSGRA